MPPYCLYPVGPLTKTQHIFTQRVVGYEKSRRTSVARQAEIAQSVCALEPHPIDVHEFVNIPVELVVMWLELNPPLGDINFEFCSGFPIEGGPQATINVQALP